MRIRKDFISLSGPFWRSRYNEGRKEKGRKREGKGGKTSNSSDFSLDSMRFASERRRRHF